MVKRNRSTYAGAAADEDAGLVEVGAAGAVVAGALAGTELGAAELAGAEPLADGAPVGVAVSVTPCVTIFEQKITKFKVGLTTAAQSA